MATTEILPFATGGGANVESQATYAADPTTGTGFVAGVAPSIKLNKVWRQSSFMAAGLANFLVAQNISVPDDGNLNNLVAEIEAGLLAFVNAQAVNQTGQCRLGVFSTTSLKLSPYLGNRITINGAAQAIPAVGVSITNGGLAANTNYYAYAFMNAGVMTLELSATAHSTDAVTAGNIGVEIKTGDPTRSLVGIVRTDAAIHFIDSVTQRYCLNWFNRRLLSMQGAGTAGASTASTVLVELNAASRVNFLAWADSIIQASTTGAMRNSAIDTAAIQNGLDGAGIGSNSTSTSSASNINETMAASYFGNSTEGVHYLTPLGATDTGTTTAFDLITAASVMG